MYNVLPGLVFPIDKNSYKSNGFHYIVCYSACNIKTFFLLAVMIYKLFFNEKRHYQDKEYHLPYVFCEVWIAIF